MADLSSPSPRGPRAALVTAAAAGLLLLGAPRAARADGAGQTPAPSATAKPAAAKPANAAPAAAPSGSASASAAPAPSTDEDAQAQLDHLIRVLGPLGNDDDQSVTTNYSDGNDISGWGLFGRFALGTRTLSYTTSSGKVFTTGLAPMPGWEVGLRWGNPYSLHIDASVFLHASKVPSAGTSRGPTGTPVPPGTPTAVSDADVWFDMNVPLGTVWDVSWNTPVPHLGYYVGVNMAASFGSGSDLLMVGIPVGVELSFWRDVARVRAEVFPSWANDVSFGFDGIVQVQPLNLIADQRRFFDVMLEAQVKHYNGNALGTSGGVTPGESDTVISAGVYLTVWMDMNHMW